MGWKYDDIAKQLKIKVESLFKDADNAVLLERIVALETALYPFVQVMGSLNEKSWRGTTASSKLFPMLSESNQFLVYDAELKEAKEVSVIPESELHHVEYYTEDSLSIVDGAQLHDDFEILSVHQSAPGAYIGCGSISMKDIRHAQAILAS